MIIIIKGIEGIDCPITDEYEGWEKLQKSWEKDIRLKLKLKKTDEIEFSIRRAIIW